MASSTPIAAPWDDRMASPFWEASPCDRNRAQPGGFTGVGEPCGTATMRPHVVPFSGATAFSSTNIDSDKACRSLAGGGLSSGAPPYERCVSTTQPAAPTTVFKTIASHVPARREFIAY